MNKNSNLNDEAPFENAKKYFLLGLENFNNNSLDEAENYFKLSLKLIPDRLSTLTNLFTVLLQAGKFCNAEEVINSSITLYPSDPVLYLMKGQLFEKQERLQAAITNFKISINIKNDYAEGYLCLANAFSKLNYLDDALVNYDYAIKLSSNFPDAINFRQDILNKLISSEELTKNAMACVNSNNYAQATKLLLDAIEIDAKNFFAFNILGYISTELNQFDKALEYYDRCLSIKPDYAEGFYNRGLTLTKLDRLPEAIASYESAIAFNPKFADAHLNLGNLFKELNFLDKALLSYNNAISLNPAFANAHYNRGLLLKIFKDFDNAISSFDTAIKINPNFSEAYCDRGVALYHLKEFRKALISFEKAIFINANCAEAYFNRGQVYLDSKNFDKALIDYSKVMELKPNQEFLLGNLLYTKLFVCDWRNFDYLVGILKNDIDNFKKSSSCFPVLVVIDSPSLIFKNTILANKKYSLNSVQASFSNSDVSKKLKIGYFSSDFREHPVSYLSVELFELHDKSKFELFAFSSGTTNYSVFCKRVSLAFSQFIDISQLSDKEAAQLSRDLGIDIAVDLTGHTTNERVGIFSHRAAPIQLSYLGYLGTMGAQYYDYLIADRTIIPFESQQYYSEKIVYLPCYQVNDSKREIADKVFTRTELALPDSGFIFCCFNNNYKITPTTFSAWMRILTAVPGSVLFLYADNNWAEENLKKEAETRGVSQSRIVFCARINRSEYLARFRVADLFLDTSPYNAGTTASDALWVGVPVLTCIGESFASRVAASLLNAIDLPELITTSQAQYEAAAIELATNPTKLKNIKDKLQRNRLTTKLFDTQLFTQHIESAYAQMFQKHHNDLPPDHIYIENIS